MRHVVATFVLIISTITVSAQDPMQVRLADVCTMISGKSLRFDTVFTTEFLQKVPPMQLTMVVQQLTKESGGCVSTRIVESSGAFRAKAEAVTTNGYAIPINISITEKPPHRIDGLFLKPPVKMSADLTTIMADLKKLPGSTSLYAKNLTTGKVIAQSDTALYLPTGSSFKLWILGELTRSVIAGEHRWDEVVLLDSNRYSLPSGVMQSWPHGAPVTLHTLASQMISISDNTATDLLLHHLGPEKVERMVAAMGHSKPEMNVPFMSTRQLFVLKFSDSARRAHTYLSLDQAQRRAMLEEITRTVPLSAVNFIDTTVLPDKLEWFARTPDLVRTMDRLRILSEDPKAAPVRGILSINPGVEVDAKTWKFIGYKGGSETGVLNMTYLLRHSSGEWYGLSVSWLRTDAAVDLMSFAGIVERAIQLIAP